MPTSPPLLEAGAERGAAEAAGVLIHGRDRAADEMIELAARWNLPGVRWVAPSAPDSSWYPGRFSDPVAANEPWLSKSTERIAEAVSNASESGRIDPCRILVGGFSQGACMALEYARRRPASCGPLLVLTGSVIGPARRESFAGRQVMMTGSDIDEWVPEEDVRSSAAVLSSLGAWVRLKVYPNRPHEVSDEEVADAREFLRSVLRIETEGGDPGKVRLSI